MFVDVHTHLTHERFADDWRAVIQNAQDAGLGAIIVNGLEPQSNRMILDMADEFPIVQPALGIYPVDAVRHLLPEDLPFRVNPFDIDAEIAFIAEQAAAGRLIAVGECGLDGHWVKENAFAEQERVFEQLIEIALRHDLPLIIHTRKRERRCAEILLHHGVENVNFHCFGGRTKHAQRWAEEHGWSFSIPAHARVSEAFSKMLRTLPKESILTETDAPYLAPVRGERNEPANVVGTIRYLAELRDWSVDQAKEQVWKNYRALFKEPGAPVKA